MIAGLSTRWVGESQCRKGSYETKAPVQDAPLPWRYRSVFGEESPSGIEAKQWALGGLWQ